MTADVSAQCEHFGSDTFANSSSPLAARLSCGGLLEVTSAVVHGKARSGVAVVRPPGHHAESDKIMGFCLYNNVGVAAAVARKHWGVKRVLIVDWDVHHGNGTQEMFYADPSVLYFSTHRHDHGHFYPGTGAATEVRHKTLLQLIACAAASALPFLHAVSSNVMFPVLCCAALCCVVRRWAAVPARATT